ncbi:hypothetical protein E3P94_00978 [Wallemia ichthyophaga]|nr:hypothetical protein E3P91_00629 [Wallemia ichthyophaga]TIA83729.1 hypothetical protein E3P98_00620 [Wallemia ichthyophaga]TIB02629.1 hypothetical protein E3P95_00846 [Wallemia ichthyophaga]TIB03578.1 hypothetical protein E3P94_00978 [Wallemia ichthyophaga]TIB65382.1 hypothetical protein E3P78_00630 [Wallemia ichthyophaga]
MHAATSGNNTNSPKASSREDSRRIARVHFNLLSEFLDTHLRKESHSSRTSARDKLTRLTRQQFQELSTDVFDELQRRFDGEEDSTPRSSKSDSIDKTSATPYLPTKAEFHPKRNQARQKLATLPKTRFKDLASDVYFELVRRYPELMDEQEQKVDKNKVDEQLVDMEIEFGGENLNSTEKHNSIQSSRKSTNSLSNVDPFRDPIERNHAGNEALFVQNTESAGADLKRNSSLASTSSLPFTKSTPRHSTLSVSVLQEKNEQPDLPLPPTIDRSRYSHDGLRVDSIDDAGERSTRSISYSSVPDTNTHITHLDSFANTDSHQASIPEYDNSAEDFEPPQSTNQSLSIAPDTDNHSNQHKTASSSFFNDASLNDFKESLENDMRNESKRDFVSDSNKKDVEEHQEQPEHLEHSRDESPPREEHVDGGTPPLFYPPPRPAAAASSPLRMAFDSGEADRLKLNFAHKESKFERERDELKSHVGRLIEEVKNLSEREESHYMAEEQNRDYIHSLEIQLKELRDRFGLVKSELDRFKRSSGLQPPLPDNNAANISINEHGAIAFESLTGLQTAIDDLIVAGRSTSPSLVLSVMKPIVGFVISIQSDTETWQNSAGKAERDRINVPKERLIATLDNMMTATHNHAMGGGLSPISLLDAAASHVAMSAIELAKLIGLRRPLSGSTDEEMVEDENVERSWDECKKEVEEHSNKVTAMIEHVLSSSRQHRNTRLPDLSSYLNQIISTTSTITIICQRVKESNDIYRIETIANNLSNSNSVLCEYSGDEILEGDTRKRLLSTMISVASNLKDLIRV